MDVDKLARDFHSLRCAAPDGGCNESQALARAVLDRGERIKDLEAERDRLREALVGIFLFFKQPGETSLDTFERIGDAFFQDTGMLRPGKSEPLELCSSGREEERQVTYEKWVVDRVERARAALAAVEGGDNDD